MSNTHIPLSRPTLGDAEHEAQARVLRSGRLVLGPENEAFERAVEQRLAGLHAVAVSSGTAALHAVMCAMDVDWRTGGQVLVPAFTFPAPAHVPAVLGLEPVAVDVDEDTWNMNPDALAAALGPRVRAVVVVDQFGQCADYARIVPLLSHAGVPLLEDAACALGGVGHGGRPAGSFGIAGCFSFHPRKILTTGEGGCVVTSDPRLAARVKAFRHQGQDSPGVFVAPGLNYRMPESAAAIGQVQLGRLDDLVAQRQRAAGWYHERLAALKQRERLTWQVPAPGVTPTWQCLCLRLAPGFDRAKVIAALKAQGIESGIATYALHRVGSLAHLPGISGRSLPVADGLHDRGMALPVFGGITEEQVDRVCRVLGDSLS